MEMAPTPLPYEALIAAAQGAFDTRFPAGSRPDWFATSLFRSERLDADKMLRVRWYFHEALKLQPNQKWVERNGYEDLQEVDEATGETTIIISPGYGDALILFSVAVNPLTGDVDVLADMDISAFKHDDIAHPRPVKPGPKTDPTQYNVVVVSADVGNEAQLRTVAQLLSINRLAARKLLEAPQEVAVFSGFARDVIGVRDTLGEAGLAYRIDPPFPW